MACFFPVIYMAWVLWLLVTMQYTFTLWFLLFPKSCYLVMGHSMKEILLLVRDQMDSGYWCW